MNRLYSPLALGAAALAAASVLPARGDGPFKIYEAFRAHLAAAPTINAAFNLECRVVMSAEESELAAADEDNPTAAFTLSAAWRRDLQVMDATIGDGDGAFRVVTREGATRLVAPHRKSWGKVKELEEALRLLELPPPLAALLGAAPIPEHPVSVEEQEADGSWLVQVDEDSRAWFTVDDGGVHLSAWEKTTRRDTGGQTIRTWTVEHLVTATDLPADLGAWEAPDGWRQRRLWRRWKPLSAVFTSQCLQPDPFAEMNANLLAVGTVAPDFALATVDDEIVSLSDYRGKSVLVNFWFYH